MSQGEGTVVEFSRPVTELVRERTSWRSYATESLSADLCERLEGACASLTEGPFGERATFYFVERLQQENRRLGGYGLIRNPRWFFAGTIQSGPLAHVSYGYLMEHLVLLATDLGLGTCWLGLYDRKLFADLPRREDEIAPAVCVVGHPAEGRGMIRGAVRRAIGAHKRKPWEALYSDGSANTPLTSDAAGPYAVAIEMARLAPSGGNRQAWRILKEADAHHTYRFGRDKAKSPRSYEQGGIPHLDVGIAMCHFELAAREAGLAGRWEAVPSDDGASDGSIEWLTRWVEA